MEYNLTEEKVREIVRDEIKKYNEESSKKAADLLKKELMKKKIFINIK